MLKKPPNNSFIAQNEVVSTALSPQYRKGFVERTDLLSKVSDVLACRLTIMHAAAGYGKSSLLSQWLKVLKNQNISTAWLTLEEEESTPPAFIMHVISACIQAGYIADSLLSNLAEHADENIPLKTLKTIFVNALASKDEPLVVFIDEYNRIQSEEMDNFLRILIRNIPENIHFVIASRWRPHIDIENLRVHGDLLEITANELRFSDKEAAALLDLPKTDHLMIQIHNFLKYTEGWPMAVQMLRLWLSGSNERVNLIADFSEKTTDMARYLTEQVLSELPEVQQEFLLKTAILERVNGDIANTITGRLDSWLMLENMYERNLFLEPLESDRKWFRFHAVFLEYLRDLLAKRYPDTVTTLHNTAATWLDQQGYIRRAAQHALLGKDEHLAATIINKAGGWRMVMDGRIDIIRRIINEIPQTVIAQFPKLLLAQIFLLIKEGNIDEAYSRFKVLNVNHNAQWSEQDQIDYRVIENTLLDYADEKVTFEEITEIEVLKEQIPKQDHLLRALLSDSLASKCYGLRLYKQTHDACANAVSHYRILQSLYGEMFIRFKQIQAYFSQGRLDEAETMLRQNQKEIGIRLGENTDLAAHNAIFLAELLLERQQIDEANLCLEKALPLIEQADGWFELFAAAYASATTLTWQKSGVDEVLATLNRARVVAKSRYLKRLEILANCEHIFYLCLQGQHTEATDKVEQFETLLQTEEQPYHFMVGYIAICLSIYYISSAQYERVEQLIKQFRGPAESAGDVRQLIALNIVDAISKYEQRDVGNAVLIFDKALQDGLFRGFKQTYVRYTYWLLPLVSLILKNDELLPPDRYRTNFLIELKRSMNDWEKSRLRGENSLSIAETEVLKELVHGYSNKKIAQQLGISPNTVKYRLKGIFIKYNVSKRNELVKIIRQQGMFN